MAHEFPTAKEMRQQLEDEANAILRPGGGVRVSAEDRPRPENGVSIDERSTVMDVDRRPCSDALTPSELTAHAPTARRWALLRP